MTVKEIIDILNEHSPDLEVKFHTSGRHNMTLLSAYESPKAKGILNIDIGSDGE